MTVIRVGAAPEAHEGKVLWFNGEATEPTRMELRIDEGARSLELTGGEAPIRIPLPDLREIRDQAGGDVMVLRRRDDPIARMIVTDPDDQRILRARCPSLHARAPIPHKRGLVLWGLGAVASVALMIGVLIPLIADNLAPLLPPAGERALGETTFNQIRTALDETGIDPLRICEAPEGKAALTAMGERLFPEGVEDHDLTVYVLDHPLVNAFALPGGIVVFFRGLIDEAETPEEIAAVYAHEVGHVVARDPSRIALRSAGSIGVLGLLLGDFAGGALVLFLAERIIQADYTQEAEAAADAYAHRIMLAADAPPDAMGALFRRLLEDGGEVPPIVQHFMSHPQLGDRIAAAAAATPEDAVFRPVITEAQWADLRTICGPPVDRDRGRE
ncbi:MAG: M48 family metallopeptidase [Shimia sp.]